MRDLHLLDMYRDTSDRVRQLWGNTGDSFSGMFIVPIRINTGQHVVRVIASSDRTEWEQVSVQAKDRCPTWYEMEQIKRLFFESHEVVMQLHPAASDYVNIHPNVLHLWRPLKATIPLPPLEYV